MIKKKKIYLVTGCAGFIGFHVCKMLLKKNHKVFGIDNMNNYYDVDLKKNRLRILKKDKNNFKFHKTDICNFKKLEQIFCKLKKFKVIHLAAQAGVRYSLKYPKTYVRSNILGFWNVLELSKKYKSKHFIFASSSSVYGANKKTPFNENDTTDYPIQLYAATKKSNEVIGYSYSSLYKLKITALRFFTVYGPWGRPDMAIFKFTKNILNSKPIDVYNNGNHYRDFTFVNDIAKGIISASLRNDKKNFEIYNIGNGKPVYLKKLIHTLESILKKKAIKNYLPIQKGDMSSTFANTRKFNNNFRGSFVPLKKGLLEFVNWFKNYYEK